MKLRIAFFLLLASFVALSTGYVVSQSLMDGNEISTIYDSIDEFMLKNPGVELVQMELQQDMPDAPRSYSLGTRQTGDAVVANVNNKAKWPVAQNVTTTLTYPPPGKAGAYLTYILINCEQSSNIGQAYVTYGGINQHFIQIVIDTRITTYFNYAAFFYGIK